MQILVHIACAMSSQVLLFPLLSTSIYSLVGIGKARTSNHSHQAHAQAALDWVEHAAKSVNDGGISKGFNLLTGHWAASYPETTGYTIPTLLNASLAYQTPRWKELAIGLSDYELKNATPEGGVIHWQAKNGAQPIVFDTGQVIFGWLAAYRSSQDERYLQAAARAGDWLSQIQDPGGSWVNNQHLGIAKVIDTRVAWAMLELYRISEQESLHKAARHNLEWAMQQQDASGWFRNCAFRTEDDPYTHTLAYTAEGLFECGMILKADNMIIAARNAADALMALQRPDGSLAGTYGPNWSRPARWSCLTGNCQMARLWLRIYQVTGEPAYLEAGRKAIGFVAAIQDLKTRNANLRGAIPGSQPLWGEYERFKIPNWAAKFFIDACLQMEEIKRGVKLIIYGG